MATENSPQRSGSPSAVVTIPRPPKSNRSRSLDYFLRFHRQYVTHAHYFLFYNHQQPIYVLLEVFEPLRYSVAAFSALVYSMKFDVTAREQAFLYYALALQELRRLLERVPTDDEEYHGMVATVLQLSTFDVLPILILLISAFLRRRC